MKKHINHKGVNLFPIGIGSWGIGGFAEKNPDNDDFRQIEAIAYMLSKGMNFIEANMWTAEGKSINLLNTGIKESGVKRENLFLTQTIYTHSAETIEKAQKELNQFTEKIGMGYVDSLQFTVMSYQTYGENQANQFLHKALDTKLAKFVSFTNGNVEYVSKFYSEFKDKVFAHEIGLNFEIRENIENGVIEFDNKNKILNVTYQPLRRNRTSKRNWELLVRLANKYGKTQNQIIYNWLVSTGNLPITKLEKIEHIDECLKSLDFELSKEDLLEIIDFRPPNYQSTKVFYGIEGNGVRIDQLSNIFDEEYDKQQINVK